MLINFCKAKINFDFTFILATFVKLMFRNMNTRLQQFLAAENITRSQFADTINVARASVSHILAGRNKPGWDFITSMMKHYPNLNIEWFISGKGKMYKNQSDRTLFPQPEENALFPEEAAAEKQEPSPAPSTTVPASENRIFPDTDGEPRISKILVFYDNGTYKEIK